MKTFFLNSNHHTYDIDYSSMNKDSLINSDTLINLVNW